MVDISTSTMTESEIRTSVESLLDAYPEGNTTGIEFVPSADGAYCIYCAVTILTNEIDQWQWDTEREMFILAGAADPLWRRQEARPLRDTDPSPTFDIICFGCNLNIVREGRFVYGAAEAVGFTILHHPALGRQPTTLCRMCAERIFPDESITSRMNSMWADSPEGIEDVEILYDSVDCDVC